MKSIMRLFVRIYNVILSIFIYVVLINLEINNSIYGVYIIFYLN